MTKIQAALFALLLSSILSTACAPNAAQVLAQQKVVEKDSSINSPANQAARKTARFQNVSFSYDKTLFADAKGEIAPAILLESPSDKPDSTTSQHIRFTFSGAYNDKYEQYNQPEIRIFEIAEFKKVFAVEPSYAGLIDQEVKKLIDIINGKTDETKYFGDENDFPYLPMIDGSPSFIVRFKRINFENGKGVLFLTQRDFETSLINNERLKLIYQGITNDKKHYILAEFPISSTILAKDDRAETHRGYKLFEPAITDKQINRYKKYVSGVARELDKLPAAEFQPNLILLDDVINSLKIE